MSSLVGLTPEFVEARRQQLLEREKSLLAELKDVADRDPRARQQVFNPEFPNFGDSLEDNALEVTAYESNLALEEDLNTSLENTRQALKRIEDGSYGKCAHCGNPIEPKRLEAFPSATACMSCKRKSGSKTSSTR